MAVRRQFKYYFILLLVLGLFILTRTEYWQRWQNYIRPLIERPLAVSYVWGQEVGGSVTYPTAELGEISRQMQIATLRRENDELRRQLGLKINEQFSDVAVEIFGRRQDETALTYLVNRGTESGIKPGLAVTSQGVLVGTVMRVSTTSSEVVLLTSPLNSITAELQNNTLSRGVAAGEFNLAVRMQYIPSVDEVSPGDRVITSGLDELIPRGLLIGTVASVEFKEGEFFKSAVVIPPFDITRVSFLRIILR